MKQLIFISTSLLFSFAFTGCHSGLANESNKNRAQSVPENDSLVIRQTFEQLRTDQQFLKDLGLEDEKQFHWGDDFIFKIFRGDIDADGDPDALVAFTIEGRGGGNNSDMHYAVLMQQNKSWIYGGQLDAEILADDLFFEVETIANGVIEGSWRGNKDESIPSFKARYVIKNGQFRNIFTELHTMGNEAQTGLDIYAFSNKDYHSIPLSGHLKDYDQILGKGKITTSEEQPECGTYWEEGITRYLDYPHFRFELNTEEWAGWMGVNLAGSGIIVQTDHGTLTENTNAEELKTIFRDKEHWNTEEDGTQSLMLMCGESDDLLILYFNRNGKLQNIEHIIQC